MFNHLLEYFTLSTMTSGYLDIVMKDILKCVRFILSFFNHRGHKLKYLSKVFNQLVQMLKNFK